MPPNGETITDSDSAFFVATSPPQPPSPPPPSNVGGSTSSPGGGSGVPIPSPRLALPASETGSLKEESVTSIDCPAQGFVGEELTCEISIDRILCINCAYSVINPGGIRHSGTTDENGALTLTLGEEGEYIVDAFDSEGNFVSSTAVNAISRPEAPPIVLQPGAPVGSSTTPVKGVFGFAPLLLVPSLFLLAVSDYARRRIHRRMPEHPRYGL